MTINFKEYKQTVDDLFKKTNHVAYTYLFSAALLLIYELLISFSRTPQVYAYNAVDVWHALAYQLTSFGTLVLSIALIVNYSIKAFMELNGIKTEKEKKKDKADEAKWKKFPYNAQLGRKFSPKTKKKFDFSWEAVFVILIEGIIYALLMFLLLRLATRGILGFAQVDMVLTTPLDANASLRPFQTNIFQDIALAFGAGFYDEIIFRVLLFGVLMGFISGKVDESWFVLVGPAKFLKMSKKGTSRTRNWLTATMVAFIFALSHHIFGAENATQYIFMYRMVYSMVMSYIIIKRNFSVVAWTHVCYDLLYFIFTPGMYNPS